MKKFTMNVKSNFLKDKKAYWIERRKSAIHKSFVWKVEENRKKSEKKKTVKIFESQNCRINHWIHWTQYIKQTRNNLFISHFEIENNFIKYKYTVSNKRK